MEVSGISNQFSQNMISNSVSSISSSQESSLIIISNNDEEDEKNYHNDAIIKYARYSK